MKKTKRIKNKLLFVLSIILLIISSFNLVTNLDMGVNIETAVLGGFLPYIFSLIVVEGEGDLRYEK